MKPALVINTLIGFGDNLWLTPILGFLKRCDFEVDLYTVSGEVFKGNPDIASMKLLRESKVQIDRQKYGKNIYVIENIGTSSASNHTLDTLTRKIANITLRASEKDLVYEPSEADRKSVDDLIRGRKLKRGKFAIVSPVVTWPSRTLPLEYYQELVAGIQALGHDVVMVGKDIDPKANYGAVAVSDKIAKEEVKGLYPSSNFPGVVDLTNQLSFGQLVAWYERASMMVNTEGLGVVLAGLSRGWNIYISSLTAPEFRLPWRQGSQYYKTVVVENENKWYPTHNNDVFHHLDAGELDLREMSVKLPPVGDVLDSYKTVIES